MLGSLGTCGCQSPLDCGQRFIVSCHAHVGWLSDLTALKFVSVQFARIFNCCSLLCFYLLSLPILSLLGTLQLQPDLSVSFLNGLYRWMKAQFIPLGILFGS